jgi:hypothetical protein
MSSKLSNTVLSAISHHLRRKLPLETKIMNFTGDNVVVYVHLSVLLSAPLLTSSDRDMPMGDVAR